MSDTDSPAERLTRANLTPMQRRAETAATYAEWHQVGRDARALIAEVRALLDEREQLAARVAEIEAQAGVASLPVLRQAWRNGWTDRGNALRQAVADTNRERDAYERAFARYMSEDPAEADKDPYRPLDGPDDPAGNPDEQQAQAERDADVRAVDALIMASAMSDMPAFWTAFDVLRARYIERIAALDARMTDGGAA